MVLQPKHSEHTFFSTYSTAISINILACENLLSFRCLLLFVAQWIRSFCFINGFAESVSINSYAVPVLLLLLHYRPARMWNGLVCCFLTCFSENDCTFDANHIHISHSLSLTQRAFWIIANQLNFIQFSSRSCLRSQSHTYARLRQIREINCFAQCTTHQAHIK